MMARVAPFLFVLLLGGCESGSSSSADAVAAVCRDIDALDVAVQNAIASGSTATFTALADLSAEFRADQLMLQGSGDTGLANAVAFLSQTLDQLSRSGESALGFSLVEEVRVAADSIADQAEC
jgi:hypothetical protein